MKVVRNLTELFEGYNSEQPEAPFWDHDLGASLERATTGSFKKVKVLRHRMLGHLNEDQLEKRLEALGETDLLHNTQSFGNIFWMFFRPSDGVERELKDVFIELMLTPQHYTAVHCRVRHPKANPRNVNVKSQNDAHPADKSGLHWDGESRKFAIETATHALKCASQLMESSQEPVYFFSDSNDLVRYMSKELTDASYVDSHKSAFEQIDSNALAATQGKHVIARDMTEENAHIDRQKGREPEAYYATFVDLFIAVFSRCVTYGIGYYAIFATKISGTSCKLLYQEEYWGGADNKRSTTKMCEL